MPACLQIEPAASRGGVRQQHWYLAPVPRVDLRGIPAQFNGLRKAVADADRVSFVVDRDQKRAAGALGDNRRQSATIGSNASSLLSCTGVQSLALPV